MKKIILPTFFIFLFLVNIAFLFCLHMEIKETNEKVRDVEQSIYKLTKVQKLGEIPEDLSYDRFNPRPNNLQDIINRINVAEINIRYDLKRNSYR